LSLTDAVNIALRQSPRMQAAQKELEATQGLAIETRAIAIPKLGISGNYTALQDSAVDSPPPVAGFEFTFGTDQSWRTQVQLVQSIYEGGRLLSAVRAARLLKERSLMDYQVALADLVLDVLAAQTALTDARTTLVRARFEYANARARLERTVGLNLLRGEGSAAKPGR
jgi:outer membrane protein TolC